MADTGQKQIPGIIVNSNESVTININAASKEGISHNKFTQFDINNPGVILNNSAQAINTRLGGNIAGNSNIAGGAATLIINEITSGQATQLNGIIEVAGKKADIIVANPAGISCDGCGFINTGHSTLTTGNLQFEQNKFAGINVTEGNIIIIGKGMSDESDYTSLLANTGKISAELRAKDLQVITGESNNAINAGHRPETTSMDDSNTQSSLGLDVSALGGMYANKITLISSQSGIGVSNSGLISADTDLSIDIQGAVKNSGKITSTAGELFIAATDIDNTEGSLTSDGDIIAVTSGQLNNTNGLIDSSQYVIINSEKTNNTSGLISGDSISIVSNRMINNNSNNFLSKVINSVAENEKKGGLQAKSDININTGDAFNNIAGAISTTDGTVSVVTQGDMILDNAHISAQNINIFSENTGNGVFNITASKLNTVKNIYLDFYTNGKFDADSKITAGNDLTITSNNPLAGELVNYASLNAGNNFTYTHNNTLFNYGVIKAEKDTTINTASLSNFGNIDNKGNTNITTTDNIINDKGTISSELKITLRAPDIQNLEGEITATKGGDIFGDRFVNTGTISELINIHSVEE